MPKARRKPRLSDQQAQQEHIRLKDMLRFSYDTALDLVDSIRTQQSRAALDLSGETKSHLAAATQYWSFVQAGNDAAAAAFKSIMDDANNKKTGLQDKLTALEHSLGKAETEKAVCHTKLQGNFVPTVATFEKVT
jgi:hypothetical protein